MKADPQTLVAYNKYVYKTNGQIFRNLWKYYRKADGLAIFIYCLSRNMRWN